MTTILLTILCLACFSIGMGLWWSVCWCEGYRAEGRRRRISRDWRIIHTLHTDDGSDPLPPTPPVRTTMADAHEMNIFTLAARRISSAQEDNTRLQSRIKEPVKELTQENLRGQCPLKPEGNETNTWKETINQWQNKVRVKRLRARTRRKQ